MCLFAHECRASNRSETCCYQQFVFLGHTGNPILTFTDSTSCTTSFLLLGHHYGNITKIGEWPRMRSVSYVNLFTLDLVYALRPLVGYGVFEFFVSTLTSNAVVNSSILFMNAIYLWIRTLRISPAVNMSDCESDENENGDYGSACSSLLTSTDERWSVGLVPGQVWNSATSIAAINVSPAGRRHS